jgi:hypothetical protein
LEKMQKAGPAAQVLGVAILDAARLAAGSFIARMKIRHSQWFEAGFTRRR